jgi:hypothetical protein
VDMPGGDSPPHGCAAGTATPATSCGAPAWRRAAKQTKRYRETLPGGLHLAFTADREQTRRRQRPTLAVRRRHYVHCPAGLALSLGQHDSDGGVGCVVIARFDVTCQAAPC